MRLPATVATVLLFVAFCGAQQLPARWEDHRSGSVHYYDFVPTGPMHYAEARRRASQMVHQGLHGHLVTLTSDEEHDFVRGVLSRHIMSSVAEAMKRNAWIGMERASETSLKWVTGEGEMSPRWCEGEPNNRAGDEYFMHVFVFDNGDWCWNDISGNNDHVTGFIVEYDDLMDVDFAPAPPSAGGKPPRVPWEDTPSTPPATPSAPRRPVLSTSVDLTIDGQIVTRVIETFEGDDPREVARRFAVENSLGMDQADQLAQHLQAELDNIQNTEPAQPAGDELPPWDDKIYGQDESHMFKDDGDGLDPTRLDPPVLFNLSDEERRGFADCLTTCIRAIPDENAYDVKPIVECSKTCTTELKAKLREK